MPSKKTLRRKLRVARGRYAEGIAATHRAMQNDIEALKARAAAADVDNKFLHGDKMKILNELLTLKITAQEVVEAWQSYPPCVTHALDQALTKLQNLQLGKTPEPKRGYCVPLELADPED